MSDNGFVNLLNLIRSFIVFPFDSNNRKMKASNKTVLITGGASGIGIALAEAFLKENCKVIICGRNKAKLEKAKAEFPSLEIAVCDVSDDHSIQKLKKTCLDAFQGIDILINNAGVMNMINYLDYERTIDQQINEMNIDFGGPIKMTHYFLSDLLKKEESAIVNVSSGLAFVPAANMPVYSASKAALHSWTQSLRLQLVNTNVKVFELMPPFVATEMVDHFKGHSMMSSERLATTFMKGFKKNQLEIVPGTAKMIKHMSRIFPSIVFDQLNKRLG